MRKAAPILVMALIIVPALALDGGWQNESNFLPWRVGATTPGQFKIGTPKPQALACLGTTLEIEGRKWPRLLRHGTPWQSIQKRAHGNNPWDMNYNFGRVVLTGEAPDSIELEHLDWSGSQMLFKDNAGHSLKIWMSRATPATLFYTDSSDISFFQGEGAPAPKYFACEVDGKIVVKPASEASFLDGKLGSGSWVLLWFGKALQSSRFSTYLMIPYPADCPMLVFFANAPKSISMSGGLKADFGPGNQAGYIALLPPFGENYPLGQFDPATLDQQHQSPDGDFRYRGPLRKLSIPDQSWNTDSWSGQLPEQVAEQCRWWANRLHQIPVSVKETYGYDADDDTVTVTESFEFVHLDEGGTMFAPLPPTLTLAKEEGYEVRFSGNVVRTQVLTAHGPVAGIENVSEYKWTVAGLSKYIDFPQTKKAPKGTPKELVEELDAEVRKVVDAEFLAPWYPVLDDFGAGYKGYYSRGYEGHFVWGNPAETIYYLAEAYPVLGSGTQNRIEKYLRKLRQNFPPEQLRMLKLGEGQPRERYGATPQIVLDRLNQNFERNNLYVTHQMPPAKNLYYLARYYQMPGMRKPSGEQWAQMQDVLSPYLKTLDWGTMGFVCRPLNWYLRAGMGGVIDINDWFTSLAGAVRLARIAEDKEAEQMLWGLFAKASALRFAMGKYTSYLYHNNLLNSPTQKDWMMDLLGGSWKGNLYTVNWSGPQDDVSEIWQMDQFGVYCHEHRETVEFIAAPGILTFLEPVPELGAFFRDHLKTESQALMRRVNEAMPAWYTMYCSAVQTAETNFQPPEDAYLLFMLNAWVLDAKPADLAWWTDVPWLARGDLYYIHKLAETVKSYGR